jgi:hypothetical protein
MRILIISDVGLKPPELPDDVIEEARLSDMVITLYQDQQGHQLASIIKASGRGTDDVKVVDLA